MRLDHLPAGLRRTHGCGELRPDHAGSRATVMGWVSRRRDLGSLIFIDLRDRTGILQVVFNRETFPEPHERAQELRSEFVIAVEGQLVQRDQQTFNPMLPTGEVEVVGDVLHILNRSLQEDILHFAGIHKSHLQYENTLAVPLHVTLLHRLPWLVVGLFGIMLLARVIGIFESVLERHLILASFIPAIVYMSDALGTQHQTLFVRDLSVLGKEMRLGYYFARQMAVALCVGLVISALVFATVLLAWHEAFIGLIIAASMLIALLVTGFTSLATTLLLHKLGQDPALGSGPFATIVSDITSVVIYFLIASLLL